MNPQRLTILIVLGGLLLLPATRVLVAQEHDREPSPGPNWVFDGNGQTTDQPALVDMGQTDTLFPINVNNHWGLMNQNGQVVVFPRFDWTDYSFEGLTRVVINGKTGFTTGDVTDNTDPDKLRIPARYEYADRFSNGAAVVMIDKKWGMIDKTGKTLLPLAFDGVLRMQDGFAGVEKDGLCGFVNRAGDLAIPLQFQRVRSFHNGYAAVQLRDGRWGYIDKRGKLVFTDPTGRVRQLGDFHEEYARVRMEMKNGVIRWGYLTKSFRFRIEPTYEDARDFHDGMAAVKQAGKWGFIQANGRWMIEPQFDQADDFDDAEGSNDFGDDRRERDRRPGRDLSTAGLYAMVRLDGRWGYINRNLSRGLVPQFKWSEPFFRGLARVDRDESFAYVSETGKVRFDPRVALEFGFVDQTGPEQARLGVGVGRDREPGNRVVPPPQPREPAKVPYTPEYTYDETLPAAED